MCIKEKNKSYHGGYKLNAGDFKPACRAAKNGHSHS